MEKAKIISWKTLSLEYFLIVLGSALYAFSTVAFIFPHGLLLGGTSGLSVILTAILPFSPGIILAGINLLLLVVAFFVLGKDMAIKTTVGSLVTTLLVSLFEQLLVFDSPLIGNLFGSAVVGALLIAVSSGILFYVDSSSGGTDIIALIVRKYCKIQIGKALLLTDVLIVVVGGILSNVWLLIGSFVGLLLKTLGIDGVIALIKKIRKTKTEQ